MTKLGRSKVTTAFVMAALFFSLVQPALGRDGNATVRKIILPEKGKEGFRQANVHAIWQEDDQEIQYLITPYYSYLATLPLEGGPAVFKIFDGLGEDSETAARSADGSYYFLRNWWARGSDRFEDSPEGFFLIKIGRDMEWLWHRPLSIGAYYIVHAFVPSADGGVWVVLHSEMNGESVLRTFKFDAYGEGALGMACPLKNRPLSVSAVETGTGGLVTVVSFLSIGEQVDPIMIEFSGAGDILKQTDLSDSFDFFFKTAYREEIEPFVTSVIMTSDDGMLVSGYAVYVSFDIVDSEYYFRINIKDREESPAFAVKIDSGSNPEWSYTKSEYPHYRLIGALEREEGYILAGSYNRSLATKPYGGFWLDMVSFQGEPQWERRYGWSRHEARAHTVADAQDQGVLIAGAIDDKSGGEFPVIVRTDEKGLVKGPREFQMRARESMDAAMDITGLVLFYIAAGPALALIYLVNGPDPFP